MKKKSLFLILPLIAVMISAMLLAGCGSGNETSEPESTVSSEAPAQSANVNILTGIDDLSEDAIGKRPIAVMINNVTDALPQYGIADADIMFETLVEYGITRMMALYGDYTKIPDVCTVRSCRYYYPMVAQGFDAIYLHYGIDKKVAANKIKEIGIDHVDGNDGGADEIFQRDPDRLQSYAAEHTVYLIGKNVPKYLEEHDINTNLSDSKKGTAFKFNSESDAVQPNGGADKCEKAVLQFSKENMNSKPVSLEYWSTFTYDSSSKKYLKQHNGNPHMDSHANKQLSYTNVIVLETDIHLMEGSDKLMEIDWTGSSEGTGYYISNGAYQKIKWSKPTDKSYIKLMDENGNEISINAGNSYIGMINPGCTTLS